MDLWEERVIARATAPPIPCVEDRVPDRLPDLTGAPQRLSDGRTDARAQVRCQITVPLMEVTP